MPEKGAKGDEAFLASNADSSYITEEVITLLGGATIAG